MPPVAEPDLIQTQSLYMATSFSSTPVGGGVASTMQILGASVGEVFFGMAANALGGGTVTQYAKTFLYNNNASFSIVQGSVFFDNSIDTVSGTAKGIAQSLSTSDKGTSYLLRWIGYDSGGNSFTEDVLLSLTDGTIQVSTVTDITDVQRVEVRDSTSLALRSDFAGPLLLFFGATAIGQINNGVWIASGEIDIGLAVSISDTSQISTAADAPASVSFFRPRTLATALNMGSIPPVTGYGLWWRWAIKERAKPSLDIQFAIMFYAKVGTS